MKSIKLSILTALAVLFVGYAAYAAETPSVDNGPWVGVIEDIQDVDVETLKQAEFEVKYKIPGPFTVAMSLLGVFQLHQSMLDTKRYGESPRTYLVSFRNEKDGATKSILVHKVLIWNVGDKIRATRGEEGIDVETIELGEISRYAAQQIAERGGEKSSVGIPELLEVLPLLGR